jgi:hypothetical protein
MTITQEERPMRPCTFELFLVSLGSTYGEHTSSKALDHFEPFPRELITIMINIIDR